MSKFSFDTVKDFDKHIDKSIPSYSTLLNIIENISSYFIRDYYNVYDLGCSTGTLIKRLYAKDNTKANFIGYDISNNLLPEIEDDRIYFYNRDITKDVNLNRASLIFSIFTLQFIDYYKRERIIKNVYDSLIKGGAFIVTEKIFLEDARLQDIFTFSLYDYKINSFTALEILDKQRDLRKIMFPISEKENLELFRKVGFKTIEPFFQSLNFKGWILLK